MPRVLLADAELGKNLAQQIVGRELPGDLTERDLGLAQVFGQKIEGGGLRVQLRLGQLELRVYRMQRLYMALTGHENAFGLRLPASDAQQLAAQLGQPLPGLG